MLCNDNMCHSFHPYVVVHYYYYHYYYCGSHEQGNPIIICNKGDTETAANSKFVIKTPETVDCLQGILTVIPMQLLSLHIAERKKLDVSLTTQELIYTPNCTELSAAYMHI